MKKCIIATALLLSACSFTHPVKGIIEDTNEHFLGTATASLLETNATIEITIDTGAHCSGTYPRPEASSGAVSANGIFTCTDGRVGIFAFSGTANGGQGLGKFKNGQKFTFVYGDNIDSENYNASMATATLPPAPWEIPKDYLKTRDDSKTAYENCIKQQAEVLDDGISPANVIGQSIADACTSEYITYSMQIVSGDNQAVKDAFYRQLTYDRNLAAASPTHYVLSRRDYLRKHRSSPKQ